MATAASTVMVTRTVEIQPSIDSQDSFLKDGMNINGAVARVQTTTEKWNGLRPITRPASHPPTEVSTYASAQVVGAMTWMMYCLGRCFVARTYCLQWTTVPKQTKDQSGRIAGN